MSDDGGDGSHHHENRRWLSSSSPRRAITWTVRAYPSADGEGESTTARILAECNFRAQSQRPLSKVCEVECELSSKNVEYIHIYAMYTAEMGYIDSFFFLFYSSRVFFFLC